MLKNKNFVLLWSSQILSQFAINIMNFLALIHVYERTNSSIASSLVWISYGLPVIVLGPFLASFVEMHDKKRMMLYANIAQSIVVLIFSIIYQDVYFITFAVVAIYSFLDQIYVPAETASIPIFVEDEDLPRANGLFFLTAQAAAVLGFGLAGVVMEFIGFGNTLDLAAIMLIMAAMAVFNLPKIKPKLKQVEGLEKSMHQYIKQTIIGFKFIIKKRKVLFPTLLLVLLQVYLVVFVVNLPAIGKEIIEIKSSYIGALTVIPIGIGAIVGTYFVPKILKRVKRKNVVVLNAMLASSLAMILAPLLSGLSTYIVFTRIIVIVAFIVVGFSFVSIIVPSITFMQTHTPDHYMARVFGNFWFAAYLATMIPTLFSATITEALGARVMLVIMGFILLGIYVYSKTRMSKILSSL